MGQAHELPKHLNIINALRASYSDEYRDRCRALYRDDDEKSRCLLPRQFEVVSDFKWRLSAEEMSAQQFNAGDVAAQRDARESQEGAEASQGLQAMKLFDLDKDLGRLLASASHSDTIEIPFVLSPDQQQFVEVSFSKMAIGRSGTGKTTTLFKMM
eukprot:scaffold359430_cov41-Prasinocladus_malaysianus.AAC.1